MELSSYFLIHPRETLTSQFSQLDEDSKEIVGGRKLWSGNFQDKNILFPYDIEPLIKLLFVSELEEFSGLSEFFETIDDGLIVSVDFFDKYWTLERVHEDNDIQNAILDAFESGRASALYEAGSENIRIYLDHVKGSANSVPG